MIRIFVLPKNYRTPAFLTLNALIITLAYVLIAKPISDFFSQRNVIVSEQKATLTRYKYYIRSEKEILERQSEVRSSVGLSEFTEAQAEGQLNADLQGRVKTLIEDTGGRLRSAGSLPSRTANGFRQIGVRVEIQGTLTAIQMAAYAIETSRPYLTISAATIRPSQALGSLPGPEFNGTLEAQLDVYGTLRDEKNTP